MVINNIGIAAVLSYIDIACIVCHNNAAIITGEGSKLAGTIYVPDRVIQLQVHSIAVAVAGPCCIIQISIHSVTGKVIAGPGCTVAHIKVNDTCTAAVSIAYITLPEGFLSVQANAYICTCTGTIHAAAEIYIAFHLYIIAACTNDRAFGILLNIHINLSTVLGSEFAIGTDSIFSPINSLDDATANLNLGSNCTDCFVGTGSIALISQNINKTVNSDSRHNAAYTVHALDNCSICRSSAVSTQGKYIISTGIVNINRSSGINEQRTCLPVRSACCTDRHCTGIIDVDYTLANSCDTGCMGIGCCIYSQLVTIHINGNIMVFVRAGNSCANLRKPCTTGNQMLFRCDVRAVCSKYIGTIVLQYAFFYVNLISSCVAGNCRSKFFGYLAAWLASLIIIVALARCKGTCFFGREGNIAGLQCCGRSCQTIGNLHYAGQMTISIILVEQLACQVVQYVGYFILSIAGIAICKAGGNALIICDKGDSRTFCCIGNIEAAANNLARISSIMIIEYSGMTAIIYNRNRIVILLVNQACVICILAAMQSCQRAACPYRIFGRYGRSCHMRLLFVSPGCTVLQIQVELADIMRGVAATAIVVIIHVISCNALPERILIGQSNIENACIIPVNQLATGVFHNLLAILAGCIHITGNLSGCIACSAVLHVDVQRAFIYADCIEIMRFITVFDCSNSAAADRYLGILTGQPDTATAYTGNIYRTTDSYSGSVTCYLNTGSIHACATFSNALDIADCQRAININLALLPLDINACCRISLRNNIGNFYRTRNIQMRIAISINTMRSSGIRIICCNSQLLVSRRIYNLDISISACVNSRCLSAGLCNIQSQTFTGHIYSHRFRRRCFLTCINCAGKFIITGIRFSYINMCNTLIVYLAIQADIFRFSDSSCLVIRLIFFRSIGIEALACFFRSIASVRESDIAGSFYSSAYTRCCQTIGNLHYAGQICILVAGVEQLISQLVQYFLNIILFCCSIISFKAGINSLAIGYQSNLGTGSSSFDRKITAGDIQRIISIMAVNNSCVTAVIVYGNTLVGILVDYTGTIQLRNIAAGKSCLQRIYRTTGFMIPYRALCHCQIKLSGRCIISAAWNIAYRACPLRALGHVDIDNRSFIVSYLHVTGNVQNSGSNAFSCIQVNGTLVGLQSIILAIIRTVRHISSFNSCAGSRYS